MVQAWLHNPPGGDSGRKIAGWGATLEGQARQVFSKHLVRSVELNHKLTSKPQDLKVVFQIPIRNPIIERNWRQVIMS